MTKVTKYRSSINLRRVLTGLDCVCLSAISVETIEVGLHGSSLSWGRDPIQATPFTAADMLFVAVFVLLWSLLFRQLHARSNDMVDGTATLFLIVRNCLALTLLAAAYVAATQGLERAPYA